MNESGSGEKLEDILFSTCKRVNVQYMPNIIGKSRILGEENDFFYQMIQKILCYLSRFSRYSIEIIYE